MVLDVTERLGQSGSKLVMAGANETIREVLDLTEISHLFEFSDSAETALRSFE